MQAPEISPVAIDVPQVQETFVDRVGQATLNSSVVRIELHAVRFEHAQPGAQMKGHRFVVGRLALTAVAAAELSSQLTLIVATLKAQGVLKEISAGSATSQ